MIDPILLILGLIASLGLIALGLVLTPRVQFPNRLHFPHIIPIATATMLSRWSL